jgi:hypothetical protein
MCVKLLIMSSATGPASWSSQQLKDLFASSGYKYTGPASKSANTSTSVSPGSPGAVGAAGTNPSGGPNASNSSTSSQSKPNVGLIAGLSIVGTLALVAIILVAIFMVSRRRRQKDAQIRDSGEPPRSVDEELSKVSELSIYRYASPASPAVELPGNAYYKEPPQELKGNLPPPPQEMGSGMEATLFPIRVESNISSPISPRRYEKSPSYFNNGYTI